MVSDVLQQPQFQEHLVAGVGGLQTVTPGRHITPYGTDTPADIALGRFRRAADYRTMTKGPSSGDIMHAAAANYQAGQAAHTQTQAVTTPVFRPTVMSSIHPEEV